MAEIFVISDTHFQHGNIISFCSRPFKNSDEMDECIIERWNKAVTPQDKVYHLGDVFFGNPQSAGNLLRRLNGKKRLILGNHDNGKSPILQEHFQKIEVWRMFPEFGLLLTHVPVHPTSCERTESKQVWDNNRQEYVIQEKKYHLLNVHGHTHNNPTQPTPSAGYKNVCVEHLDYTPINIEELRIK